MSTIRLYRNPNCEKCAKLANFHKFFDWFGRYEDSIVTPASGPLTPGEIVVEDLRTGEIKKGIDCLRLLMRQIPAYWLGLPFTFVPPIRNKMEADISPCVDDACSL